MVKRVVVHSGSRTIQRILRKAIASIAELCPDDPALVADADGIELYPEDKSAWAEALRVAKKELILPRAADLPMLLGASNFHFDWLAVALGPLESLQNSSSDFLSEGLPLLSAQPPIRQVPESLVELFVWDDNWLVVLVPPASPLKNLIEIVTAAAQEEGEEAVHG